MKTKRYIILVFFLTVLCGGAVVFFLLEKNWPFVVLCGIVTIILFFHTTNFVFKIFRDVDDFVEAVRYRDFSKKYAENQWSKNRFYHGFNTITNTFLSLNREKETQQHYLKRMLELVDTGILAYDMETMETLWMNDSLKTMFNIPHIKNIRWLQKRNKNLYDELIGIPLGSSRLVTINAGNQTIKTLTNASTFQTSGKTYKLIAFHNISATLEEVEAGAWKGLLNVMTHEIMNSIAPVSSLADTMRKRIESLKEEMGDNLHPDFDDIEFAMETIHRRSEGLLRFADTYRSLSKNIVPEIHPVNLYELLNAIYQLMYPSLQQKGILLEIKSDHPEVVAHIDRSLMEQVFINFITNATHAVKDKPEPQIILFSGITTEGETYITVADNGCGIPPENRDKIFIPFFSTKKNGSGIGLSLSREIVKLHNGRLQIQSRDGEGSAFTVLFSE
ncbi:MAG: HAMP domain-containing histidine kinase [Dysgonamonadaceae bacterium]|jgi:nitrogen fixation/metabolism regulation signal transduction histidine kinase|nr:HAMP domain-containing histidine kinase [Dysgonamonadaceae bacterium]